MMDVGKLFFAEVLPFVRTIPSSVISNTHASPMATGKPRLSRMISRRLTQAGMPMTSKVPSMIWMMTKAIPP